jgi:hypothetical protein
MSTLRRALFTPAAIFTCQVTNVECPQLLPCHWVWGMDVSELLCAVCPQVGNDTQHCRDLAAGIPPRVRGDVLCGKTPSRISACVKAATADQKSWQTTNDQMAFHNGP